MSKVIFTFKDKSIYDDLPESRYHFPRTYLNTVERAIGDWVLYYEPRRNSENPSSRGGRQAYFATAIIERIERDPASEDHFYAYVHDYLEFENPVPFKAADRYFESSLKRDDGKTNKGAFGRAVRFIPDVEFNLIVAAGFMNLMVSHAPSLDTFQIGGFSEDPETFHRPVIASVVARPFRDRAFRLNVGQAYGASCAMTGIQIRNDKGHVEVEAAHIRPVADRGPDTVRNGLALSRSIHWMFDGGLISLEDDGTILLDEGRVPLKIKEILNENGKMFLPDRADAHPHPKYLKFHRDHVFRG